MIPLASAFPRTGGGRAGSCIVGFGACLAFTHVTACMLAKSPSSSLLQSRCLRCCSDCYRVERTSSRAGFTPAVDHGFFTAHPVMRLPGWSDDNCHHRIAFWRTTRVACVVPSADDDSGILDLGREFRRSLAALTGPSMIPDARIICIFGNLN